MAKRFALLFFPFFLVHSILAQDSAAIKTELITKIRNYEEYPNERNGKENLETIAQLRAQSSLSDYYRYARDTSVILRLIGFTGVMQKDPDHVFELLKEYIHDTTSIFITAPSCTPGRDYQYNRLIANIYNTYLSFGCEGSSGSIGMINERVIVIIDPKEKKLYRQKKKEFELFIESSGHGYWVKYWNSTERERRKM